MSFLLLLEHIIIDLGEKKVLEAEEMDQNLIKLELMIQRVNFILILHLIF